MENQESVGITRVVTENFMRVELANHKPSGEPLQLVGGNNGHGKTSYLDSILVALNGGRSIPSDPVREGTPESVITVELDNGFIVRRKIKADGKTTLTVTTKEGAKFTGPQKMLDALTGDLSFDPLKFKNLDGKKQMELLKDIFNVDFSELDKEYSKKFEDRTFENKELKNLEGRFATMIVEEDVPNELVSFEELSKELSDANAKNKENGRFRQDCEIEKSTMQRLKDGRVALEKELSGVQELAKSLIQSLDNNAESLIEKEKTIAEFENVIESRVDIDTDAITDKIKNAEGINEQVRAKHEQIALAQEIKDKAQEAQKMTDRLDAIKSEKKALLEAVDFPVQGLGFDEDGVTFNGHPFSQASSAEQLRLSVAIAIKANPTLKIILIRDGSLLDESNLQMISDMASEAGVQVWIEMVGDNDQMAIVFEDGNIRGQNPAPL